MQEWPSKLGFRFGEEYVHCSIEYKRGLAINKRTIILNHNYSIDCDMRDEVLIIRVPRLWRGEGRA